MRDNINGFVTPKQNVKGTLAMATHVGGTRNYPDLDNKPMVEGVELVGDKTLEELNINRYLSNYPSETRVVEIVNTAIGQIAIPTNTSDLTNDTDFQTGDDVIDKIADAISGIDMPTKTSDLINDSNFQTSNDVDGAITKALDDLTLPTKVSDLTNDSNFQTATQVDDAITDALSELEMPTKTSDLTNDSGFQTASEVDSAIDAALEDLTIPTKTSELTNDSGFQTATDVQTAINNIEMPEKLSDLANDMTFQTLSQITKLINDAIGSAVGLDFEVVQTLPETGKGGTIYLVPNGGSAVVRNVYDEYVWYNSNWEKIGSTELDLSKYIKFTDVDSELSTTSEKPIQNKAVKAALDDKVDKVTGKTLTSNDYTNADKAIVDGVTTALSGKVDKVTGKGLSTNDYTDADKVIVDGVIDALESKADAADIPTALSDLTDDATHRLVTDTEKSTWNSKANASDIPTDLADLAADATHRTVTDTEKATWNNKVDATDIPTDLASLDDDATHRLVTDTEKTTWNGKADASDIPTKTSDLTNDSGFATTTQLESIYVRLANKATANDINEILGIIPLTIKSFAEATDTEITAMLNAVRNGNLSYDDLVSAGWTVGAERPVHLSAMSATGVGESHVAQEQTWVILHGKDFFDLADGGKNLFVVGLKNCLANGGYINPSNTNSGGWDSCARRTWCNNVFRNAIPSEELNWFKQFKVKATNGNKSTSVTISTDYFSLPSVVEVFGGSSQEGTTILSYYSTVNNRLKKQGDSGSNYYWWLRSPDLSTSDFFGCVFDGESSNDYASEADGLSPFGCL